MKMIEKAIGKATEMAHSSIYVTAGMDRRVTTKEWEKDGEKRTYIKINCYTLAGNFKKSYDCGYVDNNDKYVFTKYAEINLEL